MDLTDDLIFPRDAVAEAEVILATFWRDDKRHDGAREYVFSFLEPRDFFVFGGVFARMRAKWHKGLFTTRIQCRKAFYDATEAEEPGWRQQSCDVRPGFMPTSPNTLEIFVIAASRPYEFRYHENCATLRYLRLLRAETLLTHQSFCRIAGQNEGRLRPPGEFIRRMRPMFDKLAELQANSGEVLRWLPPHLSK